MTAVAVVDAAELAGVLPGAAALLARAYPPGSLRMDADYLAWVLRLHDQPSDSVSVAAIAEAEGRLAGFAAAAPIRLTLGAHAAPAHLVSFVATDPGHRGRGLARRLYAALLQAIAARAASPCVLTYAHDDSAGAALIERCYSEHGWTGASLEAMAPWGMPRRRIDPARTGGPEPVSITGEVRPAGDADTRTWLSRDPRLVAQTPAGLRILALPILGPGDARVGSIDCLPATVSAVALQEALSRAAGDLPPDVSQVVVPNLPEAAAEVAASVGLRRMPGARWRSWIWCRAPGHPFLGALRTGVPIT